MGGSVQLVFSRKTNARINMLPMWKGEEGKDEQIGRDGSAEGRGRWTGKF